MLFTPKRLLTIAAAICFSCSTTAQTDTSTTDLDLGRIKINKNFTQSITIKGKDLEKMPFASLYEAINAWSVGYYAGRNNIAYVIDGVLVNDANAYSVFDIEEVTIVQNALIQVSGATRTQQLALITTRKGGAKKQGITVAGQSFLVKGDFAPTPLENNTSSETNYYHQYHISAYQKGKSIQYGLSANYLRDVSPSLKDNRWTTHVPVNADRFRINGWLTAQVGKAHEVWLRVNVTPQVSDYDRTYKNSTQVSTVTTNNKNHDKQTIFNPTMGLRSNFGKGWSNELTIGYASAKGTTEGSGETINSPTSKFNQVFNSTNKFRQVFVMDNIRFRAALGKDWTLEPSVNLMFRYLKNEIRSNLNQYQNGNLTQRSWSTTTLEGRMYLLTPSINLYYKNSFNLQGGIVANLSKTYGRDVDKVLPFVTTSIDVLRFANPQSDISLKIFGSYAEADYIGDVPLSLDYTESTPYYGWGTSVPLVLSGTPNNYSFWIWQTGTRLGILNDLVTANYVFERRNYTTEVYIYVAGPGSSSYNLLYPDLTSTSHHLNINALVLNKNSMTWRTGINATSLKSKSKEPIGMYAMSNVIGDLNSDKTSWTGGWVNRFSFQRFSAGLDLVYYFNPDQLPTIPGNSRVDAVALQNVYLGYTLQLKGAGALELYADCKNLRQDKDFKLLNRKYYGLGVKATL